MDREGEASAPLRWDCANSDSLFAGSNRVVVSGSIPCLTAMVESSSSGKPPSELLLILTRTLPVLSLHRKMSPQDRNSVLCTPVRNAFCQPVERLSFALRDAQEDRQRRPDMSSLAVCRQ